MEGNTLNLHVEVCQNSESSLSSEEIVVELKKYLQEQEEIPLDTVLLNTVLPAHINYIRVCSNFEEKYKVKVLKEKFNKFFYIYQLWQEGPQVDSLEGDNDEVPASLNWCLPNSAFEGLWETLILEDGLKEHLMSYVYTTLLYSSKQVNAQIIHWNGVILLHGPPGTGKTSLCKALAQKLSIRLNSKYKTSQLIEINTHSLFSKWFSESAKLVSKMFESVKQWLQSNDHFVCLLIDEVESLTHMRRATNTEPSDSIRVVNAVLTQIDQLQRNPNILIFATSNITGTIDVAFADRADLKLFISYPSKWGVYEILRTCLEELIYCELLIGKKNDFFEAVIFKKLFLSLDNKSGGDIMCEVLSRSKKLLEISDLSTGLSGRALRKIPFLTSAKFVNKEVPTITQFLEALEDVVTKYKIENDKFLSTY